MNGTTATRAVRVTGRDVAALARVSPATVSKALSGSAPVHPETRARVLRAARSLQYVHDAVDEAPTFSIPTVVILAQRAFGRRRSPVVLSALERLTELGARVAVWETLGDRRREKSYVEELKGVGVDGVLVIGGAPDAYSRASIGRHALPPVVYALTASNDEGDMSVVTDDRGGAQSAVQHLIDTGRRRIALLLGPSHAPITRLRSCAMTSVLDGHGLRLAAAPLHGDWSEEWGAQAAARIATAGLSVDGIVCADDAIAAGCARALTSMGVSVPDDIAVVGFGNCAPLVNSVSPRLSTVDPHLAKVGRIGAQLTLGIGPTSAGVLVQPSHLVVRGSTVSMHETESHSPQLPSWANSAA